jgi:hypothetical protein
VASGFASNPTPPPDFNLISGPGIFLTEEDALAFQQMGWEFTEIYPVKIRLNKFYVIQLLQMGASNAAQTQINASGAGSNAWRDSFLTFFAAGVENPEPKYGNFILDQEYKIRAAGWNSLTEKPE